MTRAEVASELGCGAQRSWVWTSGGQPAALVVREGLNPALPDRMCVGDGEGTRARAHKVDGKSLPVYSHDGNGTYTAHGVRRLILDTSSSGRALAVADAPARAEREGTLYGVLHLQIDVT